MFDPPIFLWENFDEEVFKVLMNVLGKLDSPKLYQVSTHNVIFIRFFFFSVIMALNSDDSNKRPVLF